jgi:hypothetical protein
MALIRTLGIVRNWPDQKAAEHETIERFKRSSEIAGYRMVEVNHFGVSDDGEEPDLVFTLHFETPKLCFQPTIHTLWNPAEFLFMRNKEQSLINADSNTFIASGGSPRNDRELAEAMGRSVKDFLPAIMPSLDEPIFQPLRRKTYRLFYAGINWERIRGPGRYSSLLKLLDDTECLDIYGPEQMFGIKVWEGYDSYRGEIPFDGESLIERASASGAYLCLSSDAHIKSELLSNRLFEACAAGAVIISNRNKAAELNFGDSIYWIDEGDEESTYLQVKAHLEIINGNPQEAFSKAKASQEIFLKHYPLSVMIRNAVNEASEKLSTYLNRYNADVESYASPSLSSKQWSLEHSPSVRPVPYSIGKALTALPANDHNFMITGSWIALSPQSATKLNPYWLDKCPFCGEEVGLGSLLHQRKDRYLLQPINIKYLTAHHSNEAIIHHRCTLDPHTRNRTDQGIKDIKLMLTKIIIGKSFPLPPDNLLRIRLTLDSLLFSFGRIIFKKTFMRRWHKQGLQIWIWLHS